MMIKTKKAWITRLRERMNRVIKNRKGQSTTEYILILAIVVMIASKLKGTLQTKVVGAVDNLNFDRVMNE
jgi:hypothetical protein